MSGRCQGRFGLAHRAAACPTARQHDQARAGKSRMPDVADDPGALRVATRAEKPFAAMVGCRLPDQSARRSCLLLHPSSPAAAAQELSLRGFVVAWGATLKE